MSLSLVRINCLIQWHNDFGAIDRVLHIDLQRDIIVTFDIRLKDVRGKKLTNVSPIVSKLSTIEAALHRGDAHLLDSGQDPYIFLTQLNEKDIPEAYRKHRDAAWAILASLVFDDGLPRVAFFNPEERHRLILSATKQYTPRGGASCSSSDSAIVQTEVVAENTIPVSSTSETCNHITTQSVKPAKKTVYGWLRKWWRGGMVPNTLLPYWQHCGSKNGQRTVTQKLGRPSNRSQSYGVTLGINTDAHVQDLLIQGYRRFFDPKQQYPWKHAYYQTMEMFFNCGVEQLSDGVLAPILLSIDERPTLNQFKYYAKRTQDEDYVADLKRTFGTSTFNLTQRPVLGNSTQMALGPMMIYEIDAWIGDIYLVSALNRAWIVGKPVVYTVKDVFSRLIVGSSVTLEGPSWTGAILALMNVVEDKVALCKRYNIDISPAMWPTADLSQRILVDRGEFEGYNASTLENAFGTQISNVAPYRGDLKGIVERDFLILKNETVVFTPGFTNYQVRNRGQKDYRLDACLTLEEFRAVRFRQIIYHNNMWRMKDYRLETYAIQDDIPPIPIRLWDWGIEHRTGWRREPPSPERVRLALLPRAKASTTERGLLFKGMHYTVAFPNDNEGKRAEELFVRARVEGRQSVEVAFDHRTIQIIYLCLEKGQKLIPCHLLQSETSFYGEEHLNLYDVDDYFARRKNIDVEHRGIAEQEIANMRAENEALYKRAQAEAKEAQAGIPKTRRLRDIKEKRKIEKEVELQRDMASASQITQTTPKGDLPSTTSSSGYVAPGQSIDMLMSILGDEEVNE